MLKSLSLGTDGALKRGLKKALVLGVAGMLFFGGVPTPNTNNTGGGGSRIEKSNTYNKRKEKSPIKVIVTIDGIKYVEEKTPNKAIKMDVSNVSTTDNKNLRVNAYV